MSSRTTRVLYDLVARDRASKTFGQVGASATRLSKQSSGAGAALAKGLKVGAVAAAGLGFSVLKASGDFEKSMNQVRAVSGATGKDFQDLRDQAKDLGRTTKFSASQAADGMGFLAMAGFRAHDILAAMPGVLNLASAGNLDLAQSADIASNILTGYGFKANQTSKVVDVLAKTFTSTNTNLEQLGDAFKYAGPVAHSAGVKFTESAAAIGLMGNAGIQASLAGTSLRGAITRLLAPTDKIKGALDKLGVKVVDSHNKMLPLADIVEQLGKKGATTSDLMTIFGQRAGPAMAALIDQGAPALRNLTKQLDNAGGTADRIAKIQMQGLQGQLTSLKSAWEGLMIEIGDLGVLKLATKGVEGLTTSVRGFTDFANQYAKPAISGFQTALSNIVPIGKIKSQFSEAKKTVGDFFAGLGLGGGGGKKTAPTGIAKFPTTVLGRGTGAPHLGSGQTGAKAGGALAVLPHFGVGQVAPATGVQGPALAPLPHGGSGLAAPLVQATPKPPKSAAQKLGETLRKAVSGGIENIDFGKLGSKLGAGLATAIGWVGQHTADLTKKFVGILSKIDFVKIGKSFGGQAIPLAIGFITSLFDPLFSLDFWKHHWLDTIIAVVSVIPIGRLASGLGKLFEHIPILKLIAPLLKGIGKIGGWIEKAFGKIFGPIGRGLKDGLTKAFPKAVGALEREAGLITTRIGLWGLKLLDAGSKASRFLGKGVERGVSFVTEKALGLIKTITRPFAKAGSWLWSKGKDLVSGLTRGIVDRAKGLGGWVWKHTGKPAVDAFKGAGSWLWSKGKDFVAGLTRGVIARAKGIGGWVWNKVAKPQIDAFKGAASWLVTKGRSFVAGLTRGIVDRAKGIGGWIWRTVAKPQLDAFKNAGRWLKDKGGQLISGMKNGIVDKIKGIGKWIKSNIVDPVVGAVKHFFGIRSPSRVFAGIGGHLISGLLKGMATTSGTAIARKVFGDLPSALGSIVGKGLVSISKLPGKALKALGGLGSKLGGFFSKLFGGGGGGGKGVNKWAGTVSTVLGLLGAPAGALPAVLRRIEIESGGNPDAINLWDSNAKRGDPSRGLLQTIGSTFNAYAGPFKGRGIYDPLANVYAGVNYAMHRYGKNWISVMTRPGGYDSGGVATGVGYLPKYTPKPERVLSPRQTEAFEEWMRNGGMGSVDVNIRFNDDRLRDLIDVQVTPKIKASEDRQAYRAKVGLR